MNTDISQQGDWVKPGKLTSEVKEYARHIGLKNTKSEGEGKKAPKSAGRNRQFGSRRDRARNARWNSDGVNSAHQRLPRSTLVKTGSTSWYQQLPEDEALVAPTDVSKNLIKELRTKAEKLLQDDIQIYKRTHSYGDFAWIDRVLQGGTLADKMAAYTTLLQDSAVHNLACLDSLLGLVSTKAKRECIMATDTLKDLFTLTLLPENRKLKKFEMNPLSKLEELSSGNQNSMNRRLVLWYFEDCLKDRYCKFLESLEKVLHDTVDKTRSKAISAIAQMLASVPEQEQLLLSMLVNKLGDPVTLMAGKVVHAVTKLLDQHPNMKGVVAQEVERFLYRPHLKERAQYYALCCLNQIVLDREDSDLALHLTKVYLGFFRSCLKKEKEKKKQKIKKKGKGSNSSEEVDLRLMSVTLTGLSRAAPFNRQNVGYLAEHTDSLYALLHNVPFNVRIQTLALLFQVDESGSDRFFCALYRSLLDPGLQTSSRQAVYLNLLYRCLKRDHSSLRVMAFAKRIFQVCHQLSPGLACGLLILVQQVFQTRPEMLLAKEQDQSSSGQSNSIFPVFEDDDDDGREHYEDAPEEEEDSSGKERAVDKASSPASKSSSWVHLKNVPNHREESGVYDPEHRNPLYSLGGKNEQFWELSTLSRHFHPSVALFAKNITLKRKGEYCGDPLQDFTLHRFLERFVYRNPKKLEPVADTSGELRRPSVFGKRKLYIPSGLRKVSVQSSDYVRHEGGHVPEEERFLYDYMLQDRKRKKLDKERGDDDDDVLSVASDDFEMLLDKMEPGSGDKTDFAKAMAAPKDKKKSRKDEDSEDDDDDELDGSFDEDDDEEDFANDEDFQKAFEEYDEDLEGFEAEDFDDGIKEKHAIQKTETRKKKKGKGMDLGDLFASAEQFSTMLEDENEAGRRPGITAGAVQNKDKAGPKQLEWEEARQPRQWQRKRETGKWKKSRDFFKKGNRRDKHKAR